MNTGCKPNSIKSGTHADMQTEIITKISCITMSFQFTDPQTNSRLVSLSYEMAVNILQT